MRQVSPEMGGLIRVSLALPDTPGGRLENLVESAKTHIWALPRLKVERGGATWLSTFSAY